MCVAVHAGAPCSDRSVKHNTMCSMYMVVHKPIIHLKLATVIVRDV